MSGDSAPRTDTVTVRVKSHPEHGLGFNIRGGTDCPHVPGDPGIFITRIRKEGAVAESNTHRVRSGFIVLLLCRRHGLAQVLGQVLPHRFYRRAARLAPQAHQVNRRAVRVLPA